MSDFLLEQSFDMNKNKQTHKKVKIGGNDATVEQFFNLKFFIIMSILVTLYSIMFLFYM
jgi:hypothetical protein